MAVVNYILRAGRQALNSIEHIISTTIFGRPFPPDACCVLAPCATNQQVAPRNTAVSLEELMKNVIVWAVPKHRTSIQIRRSKRFGFKDRFWKMLVPKTRILVCNTCGHYHEARHLCPSCYGKVRLETEEMQKAIEENLGLSPIESEVIVLYDGEKADGADQFWEGKRVVEMEKPRPAWFSKNLLQKTTSPPSTSTDVKPTDLA